jgi:hypothetical protein
MQPPFVFEMYVSAVNSHVSVVGRARFRDGVKALSSFPDKLLQICETKINGTMWIISLCFPDERWMNVSSNQNPSLRELSSYQKQA